MDEDGRRWFYKPGKDGTEVKWVNPNEDGTYTSPGEGWIEFVPTANRPRLKIWNEDGTRQLQLGEKRDGSPDVRNLWVGRITDSSWEIAGLFIPGRIGAKGILAAATALWAKHQAWKETTELAIKYLATKQPSRVVKDVVAGRKPLGALSRTEREGAARFYEQAAERAGSTKGINAESGRAYNLERARYLREGGPTPPGTLNSFKARQGLP